MDQTVAKTIVAQLGNVTLSMLGARNLVSAERALTFKVRGSKLATHVQISLTPADEYDVSAFKIRGGSIRQVGNVEGICVDQLHETIADLTGLSTRL
jgi:hypothetical protein